MAGEFCKVSYIYYLSDPISGFPVYIGKTDNPQRRLKGHVYDCKRKKGKVQRWILNLIEHGRYPEMQVVRCIDHSRWQQEEIKTIAIFKEKFELLNISKGGNEPELKREILAENGRKSAKAINSNPERKRIHQLKLRMGALIKQGYLNERSRAKLRYAAAKRPDLFGCFAGV